MLVPLRTRGIDFIAYNNRGEVVLLGEAKSRSGTSDTWAAQLRKNMLAHGDLPYSRFFLVVTLDHLYAWTQHDLEPAEVQPDFSANFRIEFPPYGQAPSELGPDAFRILVLTWLTNLAASGKLPLSDESSHQWLIDSGFLNSLTNAVILQAE